MILGGFLILMLYACVTNEKNFKAFFHVDSNPERPSSAMNTNLFANVEEPGNVGGDPQANLLVVRQLRVPVQDLTGEINVWVVGRTQIWFSKEGMEVKAS